MAVNGVIIGNVAEEAPGQVQMGEGVMVFQKTSQCCRCLCCQPNIHWVIHNYQDNWSPEDNLPVVLNMTENAPYVGRCCSYCYPGFRKTRYEVRRGESQTGPVVFSHEKTWTMPKDYLVIVGDGGPVRCPCCCCLPYMDTLDEHNNLIGKTVYVCDKCLCVPKYDVQDKNGNRLYRVRPDTCVGGVCVKCRCDGRKGKCCRVPFIIRKPDAPYEPVGDAQVTDLWAGFKHECCTNKEMYQVKFPADLTQADSEAIKKTIIGTALLIDITCNEQDE